MNRVPILQCAKAFCGDPVSHEVRGEMMLTFLQELGMEPQHRVLEVGCGALSLGKPLIDFLEPDRYVALEPNAWLVEAFLITEGSFARHVVEQKRPRFFWRSDFDASEANEMFDFVVAHSVLSHVADWQLHLFLTNVRRILMPGGKILASLRLGDRDTRATEWQYPGVAFFTRATLEEAAASHWFAIEFRDDLRERLVEVAPNDYHDWVELTRIPHLHQEFRPLSRDDLDAATNDDLLEMGVGVMVEVEE